MGFMVVMSACLGCRRVFSYNPDLVPSLRVNGVKEPVCQSCINRVNPQRIANGLPAIQPLPGAYAAQESV
jgi:hypothetical protein